jgi:predicted small integral membrane protein
MIVGMLVWELVSPTIERRGFLLKIPPPGERAFSSVCWVAAYIHLAWLGLTDFNLWLALPISAVMDRCRNALGVSKKPACTPPIIVFPDTR